MLTHTRTSLALVAFFSLVVGTRLMAQTTDRPDARFARTLAEGIPIGATVAVRTTRGERFRAVLFSVEEAGIRVKPATRVPEPSRQIAYDHIERLERVEGDVSVGKYVAAGAAIGAAMLFVLLAGV